ncbi:MAG: hypothetical protein AAFY03_13655 [Pseudomonadota bacterium]
MQTGAYISGAGHVALLTWAMVAGLFSAPEEPPPEANSVSVLTAEQFAALTAPPVSETAPEVPQDAPSQSVAPDPEPEPVDPPVEVDEPELVVPAPAPEPPTVVEAPQPDPAPDLDAVALPPRAEVEDVAPDAPPDPVPESLPPPVDLSLQSSRTPKPRPAPRVAPTPVAQPQPDTDVAETVQDATRPEEADVAEIEEPVETPAAPEEAATEIVTEAEDPSSPEEPSLALSSSLRPASRPARPPRQTAAASEPAPEPDPQPVAEESTPSSGVDTESVAAALQEATDTGPSSNVSAPAGPPLSSGEKDALRVAVQRCWNVGALSTEALRVTVTVGLAMQEDGRPVLASIRQIGAEGGTAAAQKQAFETARRAIIRCGAEGYDLPREKFAHWREIEMVFNPERMRIR